MWHVGHRGNQRAIVRAIASRTVMKFVHADVSREADVRRAVTSCVRWARRLDGVVNNAAIADPNSGPIDALTLAGWRRYFDNNVTSAFLVVKHAVRRARCADAISW